MDVGADYLPDVIGGTENLNVLGDKAVAQVSDEELEQHRHHHAPRGRKTSAPAAPPLVELADAQYPPGPIGTGRTIPVLTGVPHGFANAFHCIAVKILVRPLGWS